MSGSRKVEITVTVPDLKKPTGKVLVLKAGKKLRKVTLAAGIRKGLEAEGFTADVAHDARVVGNGVLVGQVPSRRGVGEQQMVFDRPRDDLDQFGVELGKEIAKAIEAGGQRFDASTMALLEMAGIS